MPQFKSHKLNQGGVQEKYLQASSNFALPQFISKAKKTGQKNITYETTLSQ